VVNVRDDAKISDIVVLRHIGDKIIVKLFYFRG
jgi:hypothetical protein